MARKVAFPKRITVRMLTNRQACPEGIEDFKKVFPTGFQTSRANLILASEADLDLYWAMDEFLAPEAIADFYNQKQKRPDSESYRLSGEITDRFWKAHREAQVKFDQSLRDHPNDPEHAIASQAQQTADLDAARAARDQAHIANNQATARDFAEALADSLQLP